MFCPLKFNSRTLDADGHVLETSCPCEKSDCAWWEERFGKCCMALDAYLKGIEDHRREVKESIHARRDREDY